MNAPRSGRGSSSAFFEIEKEMDSVPKGSCLGNAKDELEKADSHRRKSRRKGSSEEDRESWMGSKAR